MSTLLSEHLLSCMIALPFLGVLLVLVSRESLARPLALGATLVELALAGLLWSRFDPGQSGYQLVERAQWMPTFNVQYLVGVDGLSLPMLLLTAILFPACIVGSWTSIRKGIKTFLCLVLLVQGAMVVVFAALDLLLFFMLWEVTTIPMYFLITLWGGPRRNAASLKFVLYNLTGSLCMLVAILALYVFGGHTFEVEELAKQGYPVGLQTWIFLSFFLAFAIKLPLVPFHSWLPDAHSEAPTAGSVILAGVMLKMGGYGFLRMCLPMLPEACETYAPYIVWLSIIGILYGGVLALAQTDIKRLIAYSSVSHMGFVTLGIFSFTAEGMHGAVMQSFGHGITTGALFLAVGLLYERTHTREIGDYGGLYKTMPRFAGLFAFLALAGFGLPTTANFVGEFLVLVGASKVSLFLIPLALLGIVLGAAYMLWMLQRLSMGTPRTEMAAGLRDLGPREVALLTPLIALILWVGMNPHGLLEVIASGVDHLVRPN